MSRPNFFIVGSPKCGTTAMYEYLKGHPEVFLPVRKELNYFSTDLSASEYSTAIRSQSDYLSYYQDWQGQKAIGDTSSTYLYSRLASQAIHEFMPSAQIIIMLRNPVDVMYSLYHQMRFNGNENLASFEAALEAEASRKLGQNLPPEVRTVEHLYYSDRVRFSEQIQRYFKHFPREQILILLQEDLNKDGERVFKQSLDFLGIDNQYQPKHGNVNPNKEIRFPLLRQLYTQPALIRLAKRFPRLAQSVYELIRGFNTRYTERIPMNPELRQRLLAQFQPEIDSLSKLISRDLSAWYLGR